MCVRCTCIWTKSTYIVHTHMKVETLKYCAKNAKTQATEIHIEGLKQKKSKKTCQQRDKSVEQRLNLRRS